MSKHIIFFDGECPFCHRSVRHILELDTDRRFLFAPLEGETAERILTGPQEPLKRTNSLVLAENYDSTARRFWIRSRALFRIYWIIGHGWELLGILSFFPGWIGDFFYRWFAAHRHQFKLKMPEKPGPKDRFLP